MVGLATAIVLVLWPVPVGVVEGGPAGILWRRPLRGHVEARLEYIHSVERTPVVEVYRLGPDGLRLVRMEFVSQGAGLPSQGYVREGDRFVLRPDRPLAILSIRVSRIAAPRLVLPGATIDLLQAVGDGGTVTLRVVRAPRALSEWRVLYSRMIAGRAEGTPPYGLPDHQKGLNTDVGQLR